MEGVGEKAATTLGRMDLAGVSEPEMVGLAERPEAAQVGGGEGRTGPAGNQKLALTSKNPQHLVGSPTDPLSLVLSGVLGSRRREGHPG